MLRTYRRIDGTLKEGNVEKNYQEGVEYICLLNSVPVMERIGFATATNFVDGKFDLNINLTGELDPENYEIKEEIHLDIVLVFKSK